MARQWLLVLLLSTGIALTGCAGRELTPAEQRQVAELREEMGDLDAEIASAQEEDRKYRGGLIKALVAIRLETLKTTRALVQQRIHAIDSGAPVKLETVVAKEDPERAKQLSEEIIAQTAEVRAARAEAALYSGGLVGAMKASTVATQEHTLAMLRQQYVLAKYGLALPGLGAKKDEPASTDTTDTAGSPAQQEIIEQDQPGPLIEVVDVDARPTEANSTWTKYAWKLTVRNLSEQPLSLSATIEFQDSDGFIVDDDREYDLGLGPLEEKTFTGYDLIDASVASNVNRVAAKVNSR